jgi:hypothetical protein
MKRIEDTVDWETVLQLMDSSLGLVGSVKAPG